MVTHLAEIGGGRYGNVLVAPNDIIQYGNLRRRLRDIEYEPLVQAGMRGLQALATFALVISKNAINGTDMKHLVMPQPYLRVFA